MMTVVSELLADVKRVQPGFKHGLADTTLITHLTYSLHGSSPKLRALTSDVLAAICYVSPTEGHKAVLSALSDYRVEYGEKFRFEQLIGSLRPPDLSLEEAQPESQGYGNDEEGAQFVNVEERETQTYDVRSSRGTRRGALNREKFNLNTDRGSTSSIRSLR